MKEKNRRILIVDDEPKNLKLMKDFLPMQHNVEVDVANHPEDAMRLIELREDPYPIIWSEYNFDNSKVNGLEFLLLVSNLSPLSSRLLCSAKFSESEMTSQVNNGAIQTYISKPLIFDSVSSALKVSIEFHKINVLGEFIDCFELPATDALGKTLIKLDVIEEKVGWKSEEFKVDFNIREAELNQFFLKYKIIGKKISDKFSKSLEMHEGSNLKASNEKTLKLMEKVKHRLDSLKENLLVNAKMMRATTKRAPSQKIQSNKVE